MEIKIKKRSGTLVDFDRSKIEKAIIKAMEEVNKKDEEKARIISEKIERDVKYREKDFEEFDVEKIQDMVENELMDLQLNDVAKVYIIYRNERKKERTRNIFKKRINIKPFEYPELYQYLEAIRHSYWVHTEFNYTSDIQDWKVSVNDTEREIIKRALMFIAQIEASVETFWSDIFRKMPKPEIGAVGQTFAESEVRHMDAYSHLLEILGLNSEFEKIHETPALIDRVNFLDKVIESASFESNKEYTETIFLFSLFIENASLFTLFIIIMSFNKHKNLFKGVSNVVEATSKEEQIHALFAKDVIKTVKEENPTWFDEKHIEKVKRVSKEYFEKELKVLDYIFEPGETEFLNKEIVTEFLKDRFNNSLEGLGVEPIFETDQKLLEQTDWFENEILATKHGDFFVKRSINYNKRSKSVTQDDLF